MQVSATDALAYTGSTFHLLGCKRLERAGAAHVTFAPRAITNRVACPACLPYGLRVVS